MKFELETIAQVEDDAEKVVKWGMQLNPFGDLYITANGVNVLFVEADNPTCYRACRGRDDQIKTGLPFNKAGQWADDSEHED